MKSLAETTILGAVALIFASAALVSADDLHRAAAAASSNSRSSRIAAGPDSIGWRRILQNQPGGAVELLGFLEPGGYVSIESLLVLRSPQQRGGGGGSPKLEDEVLTGSGGPSSLRDDGSRFLEKSFRSRECKLIPSDAIPCRGLEKEENCHARRRRRPCLVPHPRRGGYLRLFSWPSSSEKVRLENVPSIIDSRLAPWIDISKDQVVFKQSAKDSSEQWLSRIPGLGRKVRLVLSFDDSVGNFAAELEKLGALTVTVSVFTSSLHVVLERGYPALGQPLGGNRRLPFPTEAFDLVHCQTCRAEAWIKNGGLLLREADRLLQRGGFFAWLGHSESEDAGNALKESMLAMCWSLFSTGDGITVWRKPTDEACYEKQQVHFCHKYYWNTPMDTCIAGQLHHQDWTDRTDWPTRLVNTTHRLNSSVNIELYEADLSYWTMLTQFYLNSLGPSRIKDIRNVLDMNAGYGGFAAALSLHSPAPPWWVLNVSPLGGVDHLASVFDRGLLGVYHDWCRPLDVPPRTFDLVHASRLFSSHDNKRCSAALVMVEVDRLLRPGGFAIIREQVETLEEMRSIAAALHWKASIVDTDSGPYGKDKLLHCQKTSWRPKA